MKISSKWLRRYLDLSIKDDELRKVFTSIGLEVDGVTKTGLDPQDSLVVGKILEISQHPNADKLSICKVQVGGTENDVIQIVCGAKNFNLNDHVPVALPGAILPGDFKINKGKLRGADSNGMMCSGKELGIGSDHSGLMILDKTTTIGMPIHKAIEIPSDSIFDISLTANRGDCLSHIGVARDVAAKLDVPLILPNFSTNVVSQNTRPDKHFLKKISIKSEYCECYFTACIKSIKIEPSPDWMQRDLMAVGIRPINNVVDIGNWVMMETGQPVHVFDAKKIIGNILTIRQAIDGETMISLDGKLRTLSQEMMVICDERRPLVVAGITGSVDAEIDETTTDIIIESAFFYSDSIRKTARLLNVSTESSYRFSRTIDRANVENYGKRVAALITEICRGEIVCDCWTVGSAISEHRTINFQSGLIKKLCGFEIPVSFCRSTLQRLGFSISEIKPDEWKISIPTHRPDITCAEDIVSECLRIYGSDKIPSTSLTFPGIHQESDSLGKFQKRTNEYLSNRGFFECCNLSLRNLSDLEKFFEKSSALPVRNPLNSDQNCFRNSLIPGLLDTLKFNIQAGNFDTKFFETGHVVLKINEVFHECFSVACIVLTKPLEHIWKVPQTIDFFDMKSLILPILKKFYSKIPNFELINNSKIWQSAHSASCGHLNREKFHVNCGLLTKSFTKSFDIPGSILASEIILLPSIFDRKQEKISYKPYSQFPRTSKDLSLLVDLDESVANVENKVVKIAKTILPADIFLESINIFDIYIGSEIPENMKNVGLTMNFRSNFRTLTDLEIQTIFNSIQSEIGKSYKVRKVYE